MEGEGSFLLDPKFSALPVFCLISVKGYIHAPEAPGLGEVTWWKWAWSFSHHQEACWVPHGNPPERKSAATRRHREHRVFVKASPVFIKTTSISWCWVFMALAGRSDSPPFVVSLMKTRENFGGFIIALLLGIEFLPHQYPSCLCSIPASEKPV